MEVENLAVPFNDTLMMVSKWDYSYCIPSPQPGPVGPIDCHLCCDNVLWPQAGKRRMSGGRDGSEQHGRANEVVVK